MRQSNRVTVLAQRHRFLNAIYIVLPCMGIALLYPVMADDYKDWVAFLNAVVIGFIGGIFLAYHQDYLTYRATITKYSFAARFAMTTVLYSVGLPLLVLIVYAITRSIEAREGLLEFISGPAFRGFVTGDFSMIAIWALVAAFVLSFTFNMRRQIAGSLMANLILGTYAKPKLEKRAIMSIDINDATTIAERLGEDRYFELLNDVFAAITPAILGSNGEIYRYVGDQVTVTWTYGKHFDPAWCIRMRFIARNMIIQRAEVFLEKYGIVPDFKAALHCGELIVGEIGDVMCQLVLHGDAIYIAQKMEKYCNPLNEPFLISDAFMEDLNLPGIYDSKEAGDFVFGSTTIRLFGISEVQAGIDALATH